MKTKTLIPFLTITFGLTWGLAALLMLFYDPIVAIFGEVNSTNPLFILAVYSPGIAGIVAISVILTPLFNAARGSLLITALFHIQVMNPAFPDAQPWDTLMFIGAAAAIVWLSRRTMFQSGGGVTDVLMPADNRSSSRVEQEPLIYAEEG